MSNFMESHGFQVERHYLMETAWRADFSHGKGGRVLGVNSEMDGELYSPSVVHRRTRFYYSALPGIGHACGHNLIAICGVGVALAVKDALKEFDIPGKIVLLGTPGLNVQLSIERLSKCAISQPKKAEEAKLFLSKKADTKIWMLALCKSTLTLLSPLLDSI
jgi:hypothetical protein